MCGASDQLSTVSYSRNVKPLVLINTDMGTDRGGKILSERRMNK